VAAGSMNVRRLVEFLLARPDVTRRARGYAGDVGFSWRPNAPKLITVFLAVALTVVGLSVTEYPIDFVNEQLMEANITLTREQGWMALGASPLLLIAGSLLRGL
jgi:hypothetical protein